jgi:MFS family permease
MLTAILELGAWLGTLINGYLADATGRRITVVIAVVVFCVGVIVQACTKNPDYIYAGRFVTGLGVGNLSMIVPLYNAELVCSRTYMKIMSDLVRHRRKSVALWSLCSSYPLLLASWSASG